jgi:hypothetical protein
MANPTKIVGIVTQFTITGARTGAVCRDEKQAKDINSIDEKIYT